MRILVDYRPALRERTGVGEYIHQLVRAYANQSDDDVEVFTSSWKDRPTAGLATALGAGVVDRKVPGKALNYLWHRLSWPPVEWLAGSHDVVHAAHPLLIPTRRAAQVVTIHDLFFLTHPEGTSREVRRDYPALAGPHARAAHAVVTSTEYGRRLVIEQLGVAGEHVYVCPPGAPSWSLLGTEPHVPRDGYVLFLGTLEPRKNIGALLDAWQLLIERGLTRTQLVLAGRATPEAAGWLERIAAPPLAGHVRHLGYVAAEDREPLYAGARAVVLPSLDEGFGLTALEAMSAGIPIVASDRGALPEVIADAGVLVSPTDVRGLAEAIHRSVTDEGWAIDRAFAGLERAKAFTWPRAAATLGAAYAHAVQHRRTLDLAGSKDRLVATPRRSRER